MEGEWSSSVKDVRSVNPVLSALSDMGQARHVRRHVNDPDDLVLQLKKWGQRQHDSFNIGYVALHGSPGMVYFGRKSLDLLSIGGELSRTAMSKKILHFGSCSVLDMKPKERRELRSELGVKALTGFTTDVEWAESLAFELLLFDVLTWYKRLDFAEAFMKKNHGAFARRLGFVMVR
jgi:hypothetical protein